MALSNATDLIFLDLSETKVYGDAVALSNATRLSCLDLSETKVYGDMVSFANLTELTTLKLSSTKVSGDFAVIFAMEKDPTPGPFGHQGHESSNKKLPKLLQKSLDFGFGADQNSHCGWILGKL